MNKILAFGLLSLLFWILPPAISGRGGMETSTTTPAPTDSLKLKRYTLDAIRVIAEQPGETIGGLKYYEIQKGLQSAPLMIREALQNLPGISASVGSKDESNIRIRGFRKNEVKILMDGRPLNSGYFGNADLNSIALSGISEVQIIKGPSSAIYGSGAMGGVVNLISKEPSANKWMRLMLQTKRNNTNQIELSSFHRFDAWNYWIMSSRTHSDGMVLSRDFIPTALENGGVRNKSQNTQYNLQTKLNFDLFSLHTLGFTAGISLMDSKQIPASVYERKFRRYSDWTRGQASLMADIYLTDLMRLHSMLYYDHAGDTYQEFNDPQYHYLAINSKMKNHTLGSSQRFIIDLNRKNSLSLGFRTEQINSTRKDNGDYPNWSRHFINTHNLFIQNEFHPLDQIIIHTVQAASAFQLDGSNPLRWQYEPAFGISWESRKSAKYHLAIGRNCAFPTMRQLYSKDRGNPDLKAQSAWKFELGSQIPLLFLTPNLVMDGSVYYNAVKDLIDQQGTKYQNFQAVNTYGAEFSLNLIPIRPWELELAFAYLNYHKSGLYILTESPLHSIEISNNFRLPFQIGMLISSSYKDIRHSMDDGQNPHILPAYWVHNLQFHKKWKSIRIYGGLENFTDQYFETEYGYPAPGINFNAGMELKI